MKWLKQDVGRRWVVGASGGDFESFKALCRAARIDLETLSEVTLHDLSESYDGPRVEQGLSHTVCAARSVPRCAARRSRGVTAASAAALTVGPGGGGADARAGGRGGGQVLMRVGRIMAQNEQCVDDVLQACPPVPEAGPSALPSLRRARLCTAPGPSKSRGGPFFAFCRGARRRPRGAGRRRTRGRRRRWRRTASSSRSSARRATAAPTRSAPSTHSRSTSRFSRAVSGAAVSGAAVSGAAVSGSARAPWVKGCVL
jgi:hypothetical protein